MAEAAEIAPEALTSLFGDGLRCAAPIGNSTSTSPSQNVIRNRKNMRPASLAACIPACTLTLAATLESRVGDAGTFLPIIEQNNPQIFAQLEKIQFT